MKSDLYQSLIYMLKDPYGNYVWNVILGNLKIV